MAQHLEVDLQSKVIGEAWWRWGLVGSLLTIRGDTGYPDTIFWIPGGRPTLIELKRRDGKPEPKQTFIHNQLRTLGYDVHTCDNFDDAISVLSRAVASVAIHEAGRQVPP